MLHQIPSEKFGPLGKTMAHAVSTCVHCGFCLAACPTYRELGQEMDTPRGRIVLMKEVLEGTLPWQAAQSHVDRCLGCLGCEPACPSGVPYRDLISPFRAAARPHFKRGFVERLKARLVGATLPFPGRFRIAAMLGTWGRRLGLSVPAPLRPMIDLLPAWLPPEQTWAPLYPALGTRRGRVALLLGCAQRVLDPDINTATIEVLTRNGVEVVIPADQGCCGGLAWHTGDMEAARRFARRQLGTFPRDVDAVLTNAAGCGSAMHEYGWMLKGTPEEPEATAFSERVKDVSTYLHRVGLRETPGRLEARVAYHDACHLANAQGVRNEPRALLRSIPGLELVEIPGAGLCCGSAGSYNIDQPAIADSLGRQKAESVISTRATLVASGNIGCLTQLRVHLAKKGSNLAIRHTFQILRDAYGPNART